MAPVSTVPAVKAWLYTQLQTACTAATGVDLLVRYGDPGPFDPEDVVSLGDVARRATEPFAITGSLGTGSIHEEYDVNVDVDVMRGGTDAGQEATERAWTLVSQIENAMRADPTAGGHVYLSYPSTSDDRGEWDDQHSFYRVTVTVSLTAKAVL